MEYTLNPLFRAIALALFALTGGLTGGVPMLDAHEAPAEPGIEETHDSSRCSYQHDHNLCVVFQQSPAEAALLSPIKPLDAPVFRVEATQSADVATAPRTALQPARAPPVLL